MSLRVRLVRHSFATLRAVADRIGADSEDWRARGVLLSMWGMDWTTNRVTVELVRYSPEAAAQILDRYGSDFVQVLPVDTAYAARC